MRHYASGINSIFILSYGLRYPYPHNPRRWRTKKTRPPLPPPCCSSCAQLLMLSHAAMPRAGVSCCVASTHPRRKQRHCHPRPPASPPAAPPPPFSRHLSCHRLMCGAFSWDFHLHNVQKYVNISALKRDT